MSTQNSEPVLACNIQAIPAEIRPVHSVNTERLRASIQEVQTLPAGYAVRLSNDADILQTVLAFLRYERLCCPFFRFALEMEPEQGPIWLHITGKQDVKPFLQSMGFTSTP